VPRRCASGYERGSPRFRRRCEPSELAPAGDAAALLKS
jgi:hypothetical protein